MNVRVRLLRAHPARAMVESGVLALALTLPLAAILRPALDLSLGPAAGGTSRWPILGLSMVYAGVFSAATGAVRLRPGGGNTRRAVFREVISGGGVIAALWAGAALAHVAGALSLALQGGAPAARDLAFAAHAPLLALSTLAAGLIAYVVTRAVALAAPFWQRLRRRRLFWALAQTQLAAALVVAVTISALLMVANAATGHFQIGPPFGPQDLPPGSGRPAVLLAWMATRLLPAATALLVLVVVVSQTVLPPAVLISFLALRRTTGRLEELVKAAEALRAGDLAARVPAGGEDEVARLQMTFNAMAADLERTLRDLQAERDRVAGLLEARRQLVAVVSHELRTPVATVRGYLESALQQDGAVPDLLRHDLTTMEREVARLQRLIDDLFTLSRAEVGRLTLRLEPTDAGAVVCRLVETTAPLAWRQRRVQVLGEAAADLPPTLADAQRLEQIVSNLLGNAVRHTPPGGLVAAAVAAEPDAVRIEVRDTGDGIAAADLPHVFERFYRAPRANGDCSDDAGENNSRNERNEMGDRDGAGLGLALVRELAAAMGGSVQAASAPGEGSCFTVRLPRA